MGAVSEKFADAFRDFTISGVPASGSHEPVKSEIRALGAQIDRALSGALAGITYYATGAARQADTSRPEGTIGKAADEPDYYRRQGAGWVVDNSLLESLSTLIPPATDANVRGKQVVVGGLTTSTQFSLVSGADFAFGPHFLQRAQLVRVRARFGSTGAFILRRALRTPINGRHYRPSSADLNIAISAPGAIDLGVDQINALYGQPMIFERDEIAAFTSQAGLYFSGPTRSPFYFWENGLGFQQTGTETVLNTGQDGVGADAGNSFELELTFALAEPDEERPYGVMEQVDQFVPDPAGTPGWYFGGSPTYDNGLVPAPGLSNIVTSGKPYAMDQRSIFADIEFRSSGTRFLMGTRAQYPFDSQAYEGSLFEINAATNSLVIYQRWYGNLDAFPTVANTIPLTDPAGAPYTLALNRTYVIEMRKDGRDYWVEITDPAGGFHFTYRVENTFPGYTTQYGTQTKYGMMHGAPTFGTATGTVRLKRFRHVGNYDERPEWYVIGDSITEGFGVDQADGYAFKLVEQYGQSRVIVSGAGGSNTRGGITRMFAELQGFRPRNVLIFFGTNAQPEAEFQRGLALLIAYARSIGAMIWLGTPSNSVSRSAILKGFAAADVRILSFGDVLTTAGPESQGIAAYYDGVKTDGTGDGAHPNPNGHARMDAQRRQVARTL